MVIPPEFIPTVRRLYYRREAAERFLPEPMRICAWELSLEDKLVGSEYKQTATGILQAGSRLLPVP
jgi:hypothetical protein